MDALDRARSYGARMDETLCVNEITELRESINHNITVDLDDPNLAKVLRLRLIGFNSREYPRWDISYCYGELKDGTRCRVLLPMRNLGRFWQVELVKWGLQNNVFVKGLGILNEDVCSRLYG